MSEEDDDERSDLSTRDRKPIEVDERGLRVDGRTLSYGEYVNVKALKESLRVPADVPLGIDPNEWPEWPEGWKPGDPWPRGGRWVHDEALFITVHQVFEVWFRQLLHELDDVLIRAKEALGRHGFAVPRVALATREPQGAKRLVTVDGRVRRGYPRLAELFEASAPETRLVFAETIAPATFRGEGPRLRLDWVAKELAGWTDRVMRAVAILGVAAPAFDVLETMTPLSFLSFRSRLFPASGFGSGQFRELELLLGQRERHFHRFRWSEDPRLAAIVRELSPASAEESETRTRDGESFRKHTPEDEPRLAERLLDTSLRDLVYALLVAEELAGPNGDLLDGIADELAAKSYARLFKDVHQRRRLGIPLVEENDIWRELSLALGHAEAVIATHLLALDAPPSDPRAQLARFLEACMSLDQAVMVWRDWHIRFVERTIGVRPGTGGGGVSYLRKTVSPEQRAYVFRGFPALWEARSLLL
ncbi:MAG: hypothetical protein HYV07_13825 [Deltaproteobacteria bacterium]|nr:hypothetical protein [Deltaproteobacteria bacterium]